MKMTNGFLFASGLIAMASFALVPGCSDDPETTAATSSSSSSSSSSATGTGGSGTGGSGNGGEGMGGMMMPPMQELTCDYYCKRIDGMKMPACKGDLDQYSDSLPMDTCMKVCATFEEGKLGETTGDTLGCRIYHAGVASESDANAMTHCAHAGPFGDGVCGPDICKAFCSTATKVCTGANEVWADAASCEADCKTFATTPKYSVATTSGNTLACREYHLTAAAALPNDHCSHIGKVSDPCSN